MKISLVIRTLNEEQNIARCLDALNEQTLKPDEIIVVDNGSSDKTIEIVKTYQTTIDNLCIIKNNIRGYSNGLNLGFNFSSHPLLCFLSADCFPEKNWLFELKTTLINKEAFAVEGAQILAPENEVHHILKIESASHDKIHSVKYISNTNVLYNKSLLYKYMPFVDISEMGGEDTNLSIKLSKDSQLLFMNGKAKVIHNQFHDLEEFKKRMYKHGRLSRVFMFKFFFYPRTYLNSIYWSIIDLIFYFKKNDVRFLKFSWIRFSYTTKGFLGIKY